MIRIIKAKIHESVQILEFYRNIINTPDIRVDILYGNNGAESVFKHLGFEYIDTVEEFYDAVGLEKFHLYEHVLK